MEDPSQAITQMLNEGRDGLRAQQLLPLVYDQLRRAAELRMRSDPSGQTLEPTALVHEAYMKLAGPREVPWANRGHYYAAAAEAMRQILIDHARARGARRAREGAVRDLGNVADLAGRDPGTILAVDHALSRLESEDPQAAAIVKLRFFAGLSVEQAALSLGVSERTAARLWSLARARLHVYLSEPGDGEGHV